MSTLRDFQYDAPQYQMVQRQDMGRNDVASATDFAIFLSRCKLMITGATVRVASAASKAGVVLTFNRGGSAASSVTLSSATSAGLLTYIPLQLTVHALELFSMRHDDIGDYHVVYEFQVLPNETVPVLA